MKAILVIDMPNSCEDCHLRFSGEPNEWCWVLKHGLDGINERPSWCPLKPMPDRMDYVHGADINVNMFANGWNSCLNEIDPEWDKGVKPWR